MRKTLFSVVMLILLATNLLFAQKSRLMRKYKSKGSDIEVKSYDTSLNYVRISAFPLDPLSGSTKTITDLSDEGQAALVTALSASAKTAEDLYSSLAMSIKDAPSQSAVKGSLLIKRRIVFNINNISEGGGRLLELRLFVDIPKNMQGKLKFISWDKIATESKSIDLGKLSSAKTTGFSLTPEIGMSGTIQGTLGASASTSRTTTAEKGFTGNSVLNAALISPYRLEIYRTVNELENPSGNIVVEVTLKAALGAPKTVYNFKDLYTGADAIKDPSKVYFSKVNIITPDFGAQGVSEITNVLMDLSCDFDYRKIINGERSHPEYDDDIQIAKGKNIPLPQFVLFEKEEGAPNYWNIVDSDDNQLHIFRTGDNRSQALVFESPSQAKALLRWLNDTGNIKVGVYELYKNATTPLTKSDIKNLKIGIEE